MSSPDRVDAHQHFWQVSRGDYGWLGNAPEILRQDFLPDQLSPLLEQAAITATVVVQAAPAVRETEFLLELADRQPFIAGVVGWVDVSAPRSLQDLERFTESSRFRGIRPMLQDIEDPRWLTKHGLPEIFGVLIEQDLSFDALVLAHQLPTVVELVDRYPEMRIVIDHAAKPAISGPPRADWLSALRDLAQSPNVLCKYSGLVTEVQGKVSRELLQPYVDSLLDVFTPQRLIWGSDWPVLTTRMSYAEWIHLSEELLRDLTHEDRQAIFGSNASGFYRLGREQWM